jgi:hypothetical protein
MGWRIFMRIDLYTKGVLTVIAVLLAVIAFRPYVSPDAVVQAQGLFAGVQFTGFNGGAYFFDTRTGDVWNSTVNQKPQHYRLTKLDAPMVETK